MITQGMLAEIEASMLRSFTRTANKITPLSQRENNFLGTAKYKEEFVKEFITNVQERRPTLHQEIIKGGYKDYPRLADKVYRLIEEKIRRELTTSLMSRKGLDEAAFNKLIRELKLDVRNVFYENYFGN